MDNYTASAWTDIATLEVVRGTLIDVSWEPMQAQGVVGDDLILSMVNRGSVATGISYIIVNEGRTDCAFKGSTGNDARTLTFQDVGVCVVTVRATHDDYHDWEGVEHRIRSGREASILRQGLFLPPPD